MPFHGQGTIAREKFKKAESLIIVHKHSSTKHKALLHRHLKDKGHLRESLKDALFFFVMLFPNGASEVKSF
jgi:hypothetical protein